MNQYEILAAYAGLLFTVFLGAVAWGRWRKVVARRFSLGEYRHPRDGQGHHPA
jgi:hypothetical protein